MTKENIDVIMRRYQYQLLQGSVSDIRKSMEKLPDELVPAMQELPVKKKGLMTFVSIIGGQLGIDRFILGDIKIGLLKLLSLVLVNIFFIGGSLLGGGGISNDLYVYGWIINLVRIGAWIADIVMVSKIAPMVNEGVLDTYITRHTPNQF